MNTHPQRQMTFNWVIDYFQSTFLTTKKHLSLFIIFVSPSISCCCYSAAKVVSNSLWPHGLWHARLPCPSLPPRVCSNSGPLSQWCHPTILSCCPVLLPSIFPSIKSSYPMDKSSYPMSRLFISISWASPIPLSPHALSFLPVLYHIP